MIVKVPQRHRGGKESFSSGGLKRALTRSASLANHLSESISRSQPKHVEVSVHSHLEWPQVAPLWAQVEQQSPYSSFYLSVDWTAAWLEVFGELLQPQFLVFREDQTIVAACLLVKAVERRGPFSVKRVYLNTGGGDPRDRTLMEFNNLLCLAGREDAVAEALGLYLRKLDFDEFAIDGICPGTMLSTIQANAFSGISPEISLMPSFYVDLHQLRQDRSSYEKYLSPNTREQIRRSLKLYAKMGAIDVQAAPDLLTAGNFFEEMCRMHQSRWVRRGQTGAFPPGRRLEFHRALIRRCFANGGIQMLRVSAADTTIGVLYNFLRNGKVYFFQSGFHYQPEKHLKPGLVTHSCAIQYCLEAGFAEYDFLAGDARYKRSLAKGYREMAWVVFPRPRFKLALIRYLRALKYALRK